jgi:hypothetical protein
MGIDFILVATAVAVLLLVVYSDKLFEENRTRVQRRAGLGARRTEAAPAEAPTAEGLVWRTLVGATANSTANGTAAKLPDATLPNATLPARPSASRSAVAERPAGAFVDIGTAA